MFVIISFNFCFAKQGSYCYTISRDRKNLVEKNYCSLRKCKSAECRMAGTGNDYIGKMNVTRSNRACQRWLVRTNNISNETNMNTTANLNVTLNRRNINVIQYHEVDPQFLNGSLYADMSAEVAENFCRNPSRTIAGKLKSILFCKLTLSEELRVEEMKKCIIFCFPVISLFFIVKFFCFITKVLVVTFSLILLRQYYNTTFFTINCFSVLVANLSSRSNDATSLELPQQS